LQGAKEETDLVRKELLIAQDRLAVCDTNSKSHESQNAICRQDLDLARAELTAAAAREAEAEKALRQNDCSAARRDLRNYREMAEQSAIDAEALKKKIAELEGVARSVPEIESKLAAANKETSKTEAELKKVTAAKQAVQGEMEAKTAALQAELDATKKALESLLVSLDTRQKYEALLEEHEKEWLPHWLGDMMHRFLITVHTAVASALTTVAEIINKINSILSQIWELYVLPVLNKIDSVLVSLPGWVDIRDALKQSSSAVAGFARHIASTMTQHVLRAEEASEGFALNQLQRVDSLKSVARHDVVHFVFWGAFVALVLPIALSVLKFIGQNLIHFLRPGSAVLTSTTSDVQKTVEEMLGYTFSKPDTLKSAFAVAEEGAGGASNAGGVGKKRLAFLGTTVAQTLAAEKALTVSSSAGAASVQEESTLYTLMQQMTAVDIAPNALATAAKQIGVGEFIKSGPGARSHAVTQAKQAELYAACLGAVYIDSEFDIKAARNVWNKKNCGKSNTSGGGGSSSAVEAMPRKQDYLTSDDLARIKVPSLWEINDIGSAAEFEEEEEES
jgi:hypothetical protein